MKRTTSRVPSALPYPPFSPPARPRRSASSHTCAIWAWMGYRCMYWFASINVCMIWMIRHNHYHRKLTRSHAGSCAPSPKALPSTMPPWAS